MKAPPKFKKGDEVVVLFNSHFTKVYTVKRYRYDKNLTLSGVAGKVFTEDSLEFAAIYNSPLYKALS